MNALRAHTQALPPILVVGAGRVGGAIARSAAAAGIEAKLAGRAAPARTSRDAELALLCIPDSEIESGCAAVVAAAPGLRWIGHTSGARGLDALAGAERAGVAAFSLHPLQTVPDAAAPLLGSPAAVAGSTREALDIARRLAEALGMRPFELAEDARAAYHAAACIASNFLVTLEESAVALLAEAGVEDGRDLLAPLVLRTAANWVERGGEALTGPIARGDGATVAHHREAIAAASPELGDLYDVLAERTSHLAAGREVHS